MTVYLLMEKNLLEQTEYVGAIYHTQEQAEKAIDGRKKIFDNEHFSWYIEDWCVFGDA